MKFKIGDKVKIKTKEFNKYYGNFDWLYEINAKPQGPNRNIFEIQLNQLIACSGVGEVIRLGTEGNPRVSFQTKYLGIVYKETHYFCKNGLTKVK